MKKFKIYLFVTLLLIGLVGCNKTSDESVNNEKITNTDIAFEINEDTNEIDYITENFNASKSAVEPSKCLANNNLTKFSKYGEVIDGVVIEEGYITGTMPDDKSLMDHAYEFNWNRYSALYLCRNNTGKDTAFRFQYKLIDNEGNVINDYYDDFDHTGIIPNGETFITFCDDIYIEDELYEGEYTVSHIELEIEDITDISDDICINNFIDIEDGCYVEEDDRKWYKYTMYNNYEEDIHQVYIPYVLFYNDGLISEISCHGAARLFIDSEIEEGDEILYAGSKQEGRIFICDLDNVDKYYFGSSRDNYGVTCKYFIDAKYQFQE